MTATDGGNGDGGGFVAGSNGNGNETARGAMLRVLKRIREADASAPLDPEQALVASLRGKMTLGDDTEDDEEEGGGESSGDGDGDDDDGLGDDLEGGDFDETAPLPLETLGITLSAETSRRLRELDREHAGSAEGPPEEAVFAALSEEERLAFFEAVAATEEGPGRREEAEGESEREEPWIPWWQASSESLSGCLLHLPALSKDGTALVSEIGGDDLDEDDDDDDDDDADDDKEAAPSSSPSVPPPPPPPPRSPLPRLASLLPTRANGVPAPGVEAMVVCALFGYCWAMRGCRGEWRRRGEGGKGGEEERGRSDDDPGCGAGAASFLLRLPGSSSSLLSETALIISGLSQPPQPGVPPPPLRAALSGCVERAANDVVGGGGGNSALSSFSSSSSSSPAARRASAIAGIADVRAILSAGRVACVLALEDLRGLLLEGATAASAPSVALKKREEGGGEGEARGAPASPSSSPGGKLAALRAKRAAAAAAEQARDMSLPEERVPAALGRTRAASHVPSVAATAAAATKGPSSSFSSSTASVLKLAAKRVLFLTCWSNEAPSEILSATAEAVGAALEEAAATVPPPPETGRAKEDGQGGRKSALEVLSSVSSSAPRNNSSSSAPGSSLLIEEL
jgi:hypothetical protein